jgi:hypothetical protein
MCTDDRAFTDACRRKSDRFLAVILARQILLHEHRLSKSVSSELLAPAEAGIRLTYGTNINARNDYCAEFSEGVESTKADPTGGDMPHPKAKAVIGITFAPGPWTAMCWLVIAD